MPGISRTVGGWTEIAPGFAAYEARPAGGDAAGAVVVLPELFGVTADMRAAADRIAALGYAAVVPDLHWRRAPRADLPYDEAGRERGFELLSLLTREEVLADIDAARRAAVGHAPAGRSAVIGFSLGGHLAVLAATRLPFALAASVYGGWTVHGGIPLAEPRPPLADAGLIARNGAFVLGVYGELDTLITATEVREIEGLLSAADVPHEVVVIPGAGHGYLCEGRPASYDEKAAAGTWSALEAGLREHVGAPQTPDR